MSIFKDSLEAYLQIGAEKDMLSLYAAASRAAMRQIEPAWEGPRGKKNACYFSAEFLIGRMIYANLLNLGALDEFREVFERHGLDSGMFEGVDDAALGNGGLGRLAACFLDSAATMNLPLDGYGIRYKYGLFKQHFDRGFQKETADDWMRFGDPWSVRKEKERVKIEFKDQVVWAVPYDMPVIGYGGGTVNNLRLWQAEATGGFDFGKFNAQEYHGAYASRAGTAPTSIICCSTSSPISRPSCARTAPMPTGARLQSNVCSIRQGRVNSRATARCSNTQRKFGGSRSTVCRRKCGAAGTSFPLRAQ